MIIYKRDGNEVKAKRLEIYDRRNERIKHLVSMFEDEDKIDYKVSLSHDTTIIDKFWSPSGRLDGTEIIPTINISKIHPLL